MASGPQPHSCVDTMQQFFSNLFNLSSHTNNARNTNENNENSDNVDNNNRTDRNNNDNGDVNDAREQRTSNPRVSTRGNTMNNVRSRHGSPQFQPRSTQQRSVPRATPGRGRSQAESLAHAFVQAQAQAYAEAQASSQGQTAAQPQPQIREAIPLSPFEIIAHAFGENAAQSIFNAQQQQQQQQQQQEDENRANPPASVKAIRQLPTVIVKPEDLVDENNRECCICFEEHKIGDRVTRLPCAHIYHPKCVIQWLGAHSNTCPVCRYELQTDDQAFEAGREERMKSRKPRYAKYELERMNLKELTTLCSRLNINISFMDKRDVVRAILDSGKVTIIAAPDPVEYPSIDVLRDMSIKELKNHMNDAGVFFDPKHVVEKEDLVQIFLNSGRIVLEQMDQGQHTYLSVGSYGHSPRDDDVKPASMPMDIDEASIDVKRSRQNSEIESMDTDSHDDGYELKRAKFSDESSTSSHQSQPLETSDENTTQRSAIDSPSTNGRVHDDNISDTRIRSSQESQSYASRPNSSSSLAERSIKELRQFAREMGIDISNCVEKREMVELIASTINT